MKHVVKQGDRLVVKPVNYYPKGSIGILPEGIEPVDYKYLKATPVYSELDPDIMTHYEITVDEDMKSADQPVMQAEADAEALMGVEMRCKELLSETDYTQLADYPITEAKRVEFVNYRQAVRDIMNGLVSIDVHNPIYPTKPEK